jgi:hypothetical protein
MSHEVVFPPRHEVVQATKTPPRDDDWIELARWQTGFARALELTIGQRLTLGGYSMFKAVGTQHLIRFYVRRSDFGAVCALQACSDVPHRNLGIGTVHLAYPGDDPTITEAVFAHA